MRTLVTISFFCFALVQSGLAATPGGVGDPQIKTDHPWYPGELSASTFTRLFATQKTVYERETSRTINNDEDKALASWYWRNLVYYHESYPDIANFGTTFDSARDYWTGLYAFGFALCGTTHLQWTAEMQYLLGHHRGRVVGVTGHNSFEVFLTGGVYVTGKWVLLDHDISTVVFDSLTSPARLLSIWEIAYSTAPPIKTARLLFDRQTMLANSTNMSSPNKAAGDHRGWFKAGLYYNSASSNDAVGSLDVVNQIEPLSGYAGPPPMVHLRRNETFRRYLRPGLGGTTYAYWGRNVNEAGIPGPSRGRTWVNRPQTMYRATACTPHTAGQGRYGNGVYTYTPNFSDNSYKDAVHSESGSQVTFFFYTPYVIATKPASTSGNLVHRDAGGTEGLVLTGANVGCTVQVSVDSGTTWSSAVTLTNSRDLTDHVKGYQSYLLRFNAGPSALADKSLTIRTVVQANDRLMPHLKDSGSTVTYQASGKGVFAVGPTERQTLPYITSGAYNAGSPVVMTVPSPGSAKILEVYAAAWAASGNPPSSSVVYQIEVSTNGGSTWTPMLSNWKLQNPGDYDPGQSWSQSFSYGSLDISSLNASEVQVRFSNTGNKSYRRTEVYLVYETANDYKTQVTFNWDDSGGTGKSATHTYEAGQTSPDATWTIPTLGSTVTNWVEFETIPDGPPVPTHTITASAGANGSISPSGSVVVNEGNNQAFAITANLGYEVADVLVDGSSVGAVASYTFTNVTANHTIAASFAEISGTEVTDILQEGTSGYAGCQDAYIRYDDYSRRGTNAEIRVYHDELDDGQQARTLIKFDLTSVPAGSVALEAKLHLWSFNSYSSGAVNSYEVTTAWSEDASTGTNWYAAMGATNWTTPGGDYSSTVAGSLSQTGSEYQNAWNTWTLPASLVQGWLDDPSTNHGVILLSPSGIQNRYRSSEYATVAERPRFEIKYLDTSGSCSISGTVSGAVTAGVTITLGGSASRTTTTGAGGTYTFAGLADGTYTITPSLAGYTFSPTSRTGVAVSGANVTGQDFTSAALPTYTITASAGANGSISPSGAVVVNQNANQSFTITANSGYVISDVLVDGSSVGAVASYTFTNVTANHTIAASFAVIPTYTISGTVSGDVAAGVTITLGGSATATTTTAAGGTYSFAGLSNGTYTITPSLAGYTFSPASRTGVAVSSANVTGQNFTSAAIPTHTITATAGAGGSVSPSGLVDVNENANQSFTIAANSGYVIADVLVDGSSVGAVASYTFTNVTADHTIAASFVEGGGGLTSKSGCVYSPESGASGGGWLLAGAIVGLFVFGRRTIEARMAR